MGSSARSATISIAGAAPSATTMRSSGFSPRRTTSEVLDKVRRFVAPRGNFVSRKNSLVLLKKKVHHLDGGTTRQYKNRPRNGAAHLALLSYLFFGDNG